MAAVRKRNREMVEGPFALNLDRYKASGVGKQLLIELIAVIGGNVDIARFRQSARKNRRFRGTRLWHSHGGNRRQ
jgi:hypothetical protein